MRDVPAGIELRRVTSAEIPSVLDVVENGILAYREWAPQWSPVPPSPEMRERLTGLWDDESKAWGLLAFAGEKPVGVVSLSMATGADARVPDPGTIYLWQMFVAPEWQGSGLAGALLDRLFEEARRRGYERIVVWAAAGAAQARRFYEREGFELTGEEDPDSRFGLPLVQYGRDVHG
jgi:GNAT superfamily N-acetyltransferase